MNCTFNIFLNTVLTSRNVQGAFDIVDLPVYPMNDHSGAMLVAQRGSLSTKLFFI